jgi:benzodiazapine receptor
MALAFGGALTRVLSHLIPVSVGFAVLLNIIFNFSFSPIQFRLKDNKLAAYDTVLIVVTLLWFMIEIFPYLPWATYLLIPYLVWALFASYLQFTIASMNP